MIKKNMFWIMVVCCLSPLVVIFLFPFFKVSLGNGLWILLLTLCPVSHLLMMRWMYDYQKEESRLSDK